MTTLQLLRDWASEYHVPRVVTRFDETALFSAQSKWVTEKICQVASQKTPIRAGVLRKSHASSTDQ